MRALVALPLLWIASLAAAEQESPWPGYLDYAYVYSSAEPEALRARLDQYGDEAGIALQDYIAVALGPSATRASGDPDAALRRTAIARLLLYLASGDSDDLDRSVEAIESLAGRLDRNENRYWYHYIRAHRTLERGQRYQFVAELLDLWLHVIVPLEAPYDTLQNLSLSDSPHSGFVAALPYLYENLARLILIRSQRMGIHEGLDPLGAIVRMLADHRVGEHPEVIPAELSSRAYLERIVTRLDGTESDAGSLSFTLALFEASKYHDAARALLAERGLHPETIKAFRVSSGAYEAALNQATTLQGRAAVYTRVLRQLGEIYAAKQRLGVDPDIETPFSIEGAIEVYTALKEAEREGKRYLAEQGYGDRDAYVVAMRGLWEEIQETSLNAADYYLARAIEKPQLAPDSAGSASRIYARYLTFFQRHAESGRDTVPDSAYFAAYEAARGYGDCLNVHPGGSVSRAELQQATQRYVAALRLFPFDRHLWPALAASLERVGRENEYLELARPVAEAVTTSRHIDGWIRAGEPGAEPIAAIRRALSDSQVLLYLGFAGEDTVRELESSVAELRAKRAGAKKALDGLLAQRGSLGRKNIAATASIGSSGTRAGDAIDALDVEAIDGRIREAQRSVERLDKQIAARTNALPLFKGTLGTEALADELRARRDHPVHTLLRRMFEERKT